MYACALSVARLGEGLLLTGGLPGGSITGGSLPDYQQFVAGSGSGKTNDVVTAGDSTISDAEPHDHPLEPAAGTGEELGCLPGCHARPVLPAEGYGNAALEAGARATMSTIALDDVS